MQRARRTTRATTTRDPLGWPRTRRPPAAS